MSRSLTVLAAFLAALTTSSAMADSRAKALTRRAEAQTLVDDILSGKPLHAAVNRIRFLGEQTYAVRELRDVIYRSADPDQRERAILAMSDLAHPLGERTLLVLVWDPDPAIRMKALSGLARMGSRHSKRVRPLLQDKTLGVRREAARALAASKDKSSSKWLLRAARSEGEPAVRAEMLVAVGTLGDRRSASGVAPFLRHSSETTRLAAVRALCLLGDRRGLSAVEEMTRHEDPHQRRQALSLLESARSPGAVKLVRPLLGDPDPKVSAVAARLLYQAGDESMLEWLVLASHRSKGDEKWLFETELEALHLTEDARSAILAKAGEK